MDTLLPTTKLRRGRRTARQDRALADPGEALVSLDGISLDRLVTGAGPLVLDIGFGSGEAVVSFAESDPRVGILAVDMHSPGIGDLLASITERSLANVRVVDADIRLTLERIPRGRLSGVRTYFPDPWPKKRHHRRRLVTSDFADALAERVATGGYWHLATDWPDYAVAIEEALAASHVWRGSRIPRPDWRPVTRYERRGLTAGRQAIDLWFERVAG